jgi:hypothetical protein
MNVMITIAMYLQEIELAEVLQLYYVKIPDMVECNNISISTTCYYKYKNNSLITYIMKDN